MPRQTTASGFPFYTGGDKPAGHEQQRDLAETLELVGAKYDAGGLATSGDRAGQPLPEPGRRGRFYRDTGQRGVLWIDTETEWQPIVPFPIGGVLDWPAAVAPPGPALWLEELGQTISKAAFPELFAAYGVTAANLTLPNRSGRTQIGAGPAAAGTSARAVGQTGGAESVALTGGQLPAHNHSASQDSHNHGPESADAPFLAISGGSNLSAWGLPPRNPNAPQGLSITNTGWARPNVYIGNSGNNEAHPNMQPFTVTRYFVRAR